MPLLSSENMKIPLSGGIPTNKNLVVCQLPLAIKTMSRKRVSEGDNIGDGSGSERPARKRSKSSNTAVSDGVVKTAFDNLDITITGAAVDEILAGARGDKSTRIQVVGPRPVPPWLAMVKNVRTYAADNGLEDQLFCRLKRIGRLSHFETLYDCLDELEAFARRYPWVEGKEYMTSRGGGSDTEIRIINMGKSHPEWDEEDEYVGTVHRAGDIHEALLRFTQKSRSLFLESSFWRVDTSWNPVAHGTPVLDIVHFIDDEHGSGSGGGGDDGGYDAEAETSLVRLGIGIVRVSNITQGMGKTGVHNITGLPTLSCWKSLLQKVIRLRPRSVELGGSGTVTRMEPSVLLRHLCLMMMDHPGVFVENVHKFVTGVETFCKRLAVIMLEDACPMTTGEGGNRVPDTRLILSLMGGAYCARELAGWRPSEALVEYWIDGAIRAYNSTSRFVYDASVRPATYKFAASNTDLQRISSLLDELGSFDGDKNMAAYIAMKTRVSPRGAAVHAIDVMHVSHALDQHCMGNVVYYMEPGLVPTPVRAGYPFGAFFSQLFTRVCGVNPRCSGTTVVDTEDPFVAGCLDAQRRLFHVLNAGLLPMPEGIVASQSYIVDYGIPDSWLAGMAGCILGNERNTIVTLDPSDITRIRVAFAKEATDNNEEVARRRALAILRGGILLDGSPPPVPELAGARMKWCDQTSQVLITRAGSHTWEPWQVVCSGSAEFTLARYDPKDVYTVGPNSIIAHDAFAWLESVCSGSGGDSDDDVLPATCKQRLVTFLSKPGLSIEMPRLTLQGDGRVDAANVLDVRVFKFMCEMSRMFPAALSQTPGQPSRFTVHSRILLDHIVEHMSIPDPVWERWPGEFSLGIAFKDEQLEAIRHLESRDDRRAFYLYMKVGAGKTHVVNWFINHLNTLGRLPPYVLWSLPITALDTVRRQVAEWGFATSTVDVNRGGVPMFRRNHINFINEDLLRVHVDELLLYAPETLAIFDEVHKMQRATQRTAAGLRIAASAQRSMFLSGTPIINGDKRYLMRWLQHLVDFQVTARNFWTAFGAMVAVDTAREGVRRVNNYEFEIPLAFMANVAGPRYIELLPRSLGGQRDTPLQPAHVASLLHMEYMAVSRVMADIVTAADEDGDVHRAMLVARNKEHLCDIRNALTDAGVPEEGIGSVGATVRVPRDPIVVITPVQRAEGYSLSLYFDTMITGVYPSSQAKRTQLRGRINRQDQPSAEVNYVTIHTGITTAIMRNHLYAANLETIAGQLAQM